MPTPPPASSSRPSPAASGGNGGRPAVDPAAQQAAFNAASAALRAMLTEFSFPESSHSAVERSILAELAAPGVAVAQLKEAGKALSFLAQWDGVAELSPEAASMVEAVGTAAADMSALYTLVKEDPATYLAAKAKTFRAFQRAGGVFV